MNRTLAIALLLSPLMVLLQGCEREVSTPPEAPKAASAESAVANTVQPVPAAAMKQEGEPVPATASGDMRVLAQKSGCFACHALDKKMVGPAWNDVAAKYRGQKGAEAKLIAKVAKGGSGVWGGVPMPANEPRVKADDIRALVKFILNLK